MEAKRLDLDNPNELRGLYEQLVTAKKNHSDTGIFLRWSLWSCAIVLLLVVLERVWDAMIGTTALSENVFRWLRSLSMVWAIVVHGLYQFWMSRKYKSKSRDTLSFEVIEGIYRSSEKVRVGLEARHSIKLSDVIRFEIGPSYSINDCQKFPLLSIKCLNEEGAMDKVYPSKGSTILVSRPSNWSDGVILKTMHYVQS